ncbi:hypothetical protein WICMUC_002777 [Wickerhamomyces mucosus]|uniref:Uncharacterized protein n=1 Tax=Wickerhamomyces mucosus TaxID=1378264 RepID=A0A9P8TDH3_9ASCO|nr:hypothetical protein WICMUC_002777 [Wickerhamomyces mucosus]
MTRTNGNSITTENVLNLINNGISSGFSSICLQHSSNIIRALLKSPVLWANSFSSSESESESPSLSLSLSNSSSDFSAFVIVSISSSSGSSYETDCLVLESSFSSSASLSLSPVLEEIRSSEVIWVCDFGTALPISGNESEFGFFCFLNSLVIADSRPLRSFVIMTLSKCSFETSYSSL